MSAAVSAALAMAAVLGAMSLIAVWSRRESRLRHAAVPLLIVSIILGAALATEPLGWHKPAILAWRLHDQKVRVLAMRLDMYKAIYLYVEIAGQPEPRAVYLSWNSELARELQEALDTERKGRAQGVYIRLSDRRGPKVSVSGMSRNQRSPKRIPDTGMSIQ